MSKTGLKGTKTWANLKEGFAGESQANRRYLYFARRADIEGQPDTAGVFRDTAEGETGHAFGHFDFLAEVGDPVTGVPVGDSAEAWAYAQSKGNATRIIGPNCPGIITPGEALVGITPANITGKGPIGLVSKSGTLTYQMMFELRDLGFSTAIGIGGDPIIGTTHIDALAAFEADPETKAIVMIGEIGGDAEERAADYIKAHVTKPVVGYVAGFTAPEGKMMAHAGAIVSAGAGNAEGKKGGR